MKHCQTFHKHEALDLRHLKSMHVYEFSEVFLTSSDTMQRIIPILVQYNSDSCSREQITR